MIDFISILMAANVPSTKDKDKADKAQRRISYGKVFDLFCAKEGSKFNPDALVKFYAIANNPLTYSDASIVFSRFVADSKVSHLKQLNREGFIECMESAAEKINKNGEKQEILGEVLDYSYEFFSQNKEALLDLLNLPPDLSTTEVNELLIALSSEGFQTA